VIIHKIIPFKSKNVEKIGKALKRSHAVKLGNQWYFPVQANYDKHKDVITFKLDQVHHFDI